MLAFTLPQKAAGNNTDRRRHCSTNDVKKEKPRKPWLRGFPDSDEIVLADAAAADQIDDTEQDKRADKRD
jgi:hypothetical protein